MKLEAEKSYVGRINKVCDYISEHLDDELTVEILSQVANFSRCHFHRQFAEYVGINVSRYILMMRLKRAAYQLAFNLQYRVIDIALNARFESPEAFSRAFKKMFFQTPSQFRQKPDWKLWNEKFLFPTIERKQAVDVKIVDFEETKVAVLEHRGNPALLNNSVAHFIEWRKETGLSPVATSKTFGLAYDDPKATEAEDFRFDICGSVMEDVPVNAQNVVTKLIPAGRCASIRHFGAHEAMDDKVRYLYGDWLPAGGEELREFPCYFQYINFFPEVAEHELITDIFLPIS